MQIKENITTFSLSATDSSRFRKIVLDVLSEACKITDEEYGGIGTLGEKQMHAAIKRFICPDETCHEVKIDGSPLCIDRGDGDNKNKTRRFVADVMKDGIIYEIQTGSFAPLREKIKWILENTTYKIIVIHPIAETKWLNYINSNGDIEKRTKSPKKGSFKDIAGEVYYFQEFIENPRFSLVLLMMEAEQYKKNSVTSSKKRPKYEKYELIPISLLSAQIFKSTQDYKIFIPDALPEKFTTKNYSILTKIRGRDAYSIVKTLTYLGLFEEAGKIGRATAYTLKK